jgi:hypothetical protein
MDSAAGTTCTQTKKLLILSESECDPADVIALLPVSDQQTRIEYEISAHFVSSLHKKNAAKVLQQTYANNTDQFDHVIVYKMIHLKNFRMPLLLFLKACVCDAFFIFSHLDPQVSQKD